MVKISGNVDTLFSFKSLRNRYRSLILSSKNNIIPILFLHLLLTLGASGRLSIIGYTANLLHPYQPLPQPVHLPIASLLSLPTKYPNVASHWSTTLLLFGLISRIFGLLYGFLTLEADDGFSFFSRFNCRYFLPFSSSTSGPISHNRLFLDFLFNFYFFSSI